MEFSLHNGTTQTDLPTTEDFSRWVAAVVLPEYPSAEIALRVVDEEESAKLNQEYRGKKGPTNVLSFTLDTDPLVGDIVICAPLVAQEANAQGISATAHWAHLTVHACYHIMGYDHQSDAEAMIMEQQEITTLKALGYEDPYGNKHHD